MRQLRCACTRAWRAGVQAGIELEGVLELCERGREFVLGQVHLAFVEIE